MNSELGLHTASQLNLPQHMPNRRVVITGFGLVTPLGIGVEKSWNRLCQGVSAIKSTRGLGPAFASLPSQIAAWIDEKEMQDKIAIVSCLIIS